MFVVEFTKPTYLMQGRMNLMTDEECGQNIANIAWQTPEYYSNFVRERYLICAGSAPTKFGVSACSVS